ncbi:MAG TPA: 3-hydroxyacyl-CoA dehydrogenase NAD-binding domain-containing protein [Acidobacteriaceae bacterium]|nr:3-hydroxyacyl-CoA dehydrogenase NAD-binding domain-containing protein [Acidobacteriaceae bacterium]
MTQSGRAKSGLIRRVAVLGAGTMGSRIAGHIANAGVPVLLLDMLPQGTAADAPEARRNRLAIAAIEDLKRSKPGALFTSETARLIVPGNFEDDLPRLADCDWVIEAVAENLEIKKALLTRVSAVCAGQAILTTNTSGLPVSEVAAGLPETQRRRFFGTHFFNPPRYMRLVEIIATRESDVDAVAAIAHFCDLRLGKTVVRANDTPNFIANRIGTFAMLNAVRLMIEQDLTIEEVDALTGAVIGWPKTGTFRLADLVGIDVLAHVADNFYSQSERIEDERRDVTLPAFLREMLRRGWLGDKTGHGFYKKAGLDAEGREIRLALDWKTLEYRPVKKANFPTLDLLKGVEPVTARLVQLMAASSTKDMAAAFHWPFLTELFTYAANRLAPKLHPIAATAPDIDAAMRTGFNWELGPFEMFDAVDVRETTDRMRSTGRPISPNVERLLAAGRSWYREDRSVSSGRSCFDPLSNEYGLVAVAEDTLSFAAARRERAPVRGNPGASVVDLGDGIAGIELHSKMNALGDDIVSLITQTLRVGSREVADFEGFVISGAGVNFSAGANLMQLLLLMQDSEWDEIDLAVRAFQRMTQAIKFCPRPVVVAPYGMCLGGGTEIALHASARRAHCELYMGLVETGVGLIPAGGGSKEMLLRALECGPVNGRGDELTVFEALKWRFEAIGKAKVSSSAADAKMLGYLGQGDVITMNRDRLLAEAKRTGRELADTGYAPPQPRMAIPAPGTSVLATLRAGAWMMRQAEYISDHDLTVANWAAHVLCGGNVAPGTLMTEEYLLDLEREAFLSLCGEEKTRERIAFTLKTGKPLRN